MAITARREPVPPQFGIGWKELLGHVQQVPVLAPSGSANDYAGFIIKDIDSLLYSKLPSSLAKPDLSKWRKKKNCSYHMELFILFSYHCTSAQPFGVSSCTL